MIKKEYYAVIVGGGASGIMCAIAAKSKNRNLKIAVIEKNDRVGKKLLSTGNGRCNLTNSRLTADKYAGSFVPKAEKMFRKYTTDYIVNIFKQLGLLTYADYDGRYYPVCRQASAVLDVMRFACERLGVDIFCNETAKSIKKADNFFCVTTENHKFISQKLVMACGAKASPKLGGTASAADYLKNLGHKIIPFSPALCPVKVKSDLLKSLKGLRASCKAALADRNGSIIKTESGEIQFTENSLSGICIFNLSLYTKQNYIIILDLLPNYSFAELFNLITKQKSLFYNRPADDLFAGIFQKRLGQAILKMSNIKDFSRFCSSLTENEINLVCRTIKQMEFKVIQNEGFDRAQCTLGGAFGEEIDENTMESKIVKGLYVCGEAIDICGECGGYNLHFAFSSGHNAGENL